MVERIEMWLSHLLGAAWVFMAQHLVWGALALVIVGCATAVACMIGKR